MLPTLLPAFQWRYTSLIGMVLSPPHLSHSSPAPSQKYLFPYWGQGANRGVLIEVVPHSLCENIGKLHQKVSLVSLRQMKKKKVTAACTQGKNLFTPCLFFGGGGSKIYKTQTKRRCYSSSIGVIMLVLHGKGMVS